VGLTGGIREGWWGVGVEGWRDHVNVPYEVQQIGLKRGWKCDAGTLMKAYECAQYGNSIEIS
jgi:hypothetical protein